MTYTFENKTKHIPWQWKQNISKTFKKLSKKGGVTDFRFFILLKLLKMIDQISYSHWFSLKMLFDSVDYIYGEHFQKLIILNSKLGTD